MEQQRTLRFTLARQTGQLAVSKRISEELLNHPRNLEAIRQEIPSEVASKNRRAKLLKRIARRAMSDVTECPVDQLPAHVARLRDLEDILAHEIQNDFKHTAESIVSANPSAPYSLADFLKCLEMTRKEHRAPAFVNNRDEAIARIDKNISTLAGLLAQNRELLELTQRQFEQSENEEAA